MVDFSVADQKTLKRLIERRHPDYAANLGHWDFLEACYKGGRAWFAENIFRYLKEGDTEFNDRVGRAYRFNHTREVVDLVNKYIFKSTVTRNNDDASGAVKTFWRKATRSGLNIDQFMKAIGIKSSIYGRIWVVVDSTVPPLPEGEVLTVADEKALGGTIYAYALTPQVVLDMSFDDDGALNWMLIHEAVRDDEDPLTSTGAMKSRFRLWMRDAWFLFERETRGNKTTVSIIDQGANRLGEVPIFAVDNVHCDDQYVAPAMIGDIAYLDRAVANYLSNLDAIIQDQTFSQLAMPAQGMLPGEEGYDKLIEMGTKRIFTYDGEHGVSPHYLSPDPKQAGVVLEVINKIINEIYHSVGMGGERTKQDNAVGIDNSSGVAKAYDFERMNSLLAAKADSLDTAENKLIRLVRLYAGEQPEETDPDLVKYPDSFDVRGLYDEFEIAERLALIEAPEELRRLQMKSVVEKLYPRLSEELKREMEKALKSWPPEPLGVMTSLAKIPGREASGSMKTQPPQAAPKVGSQQGQNNSGDKTAA